MEKLIFHMDKTVRTSDQLLLWIHRRGHAPVVFAERNIRGLLATPPRPLVEFLLVESGQFRLCVGNNRFVDLRAGQMVWMNAHFGNRADLSDPHAAYSCISLDAAHEPAFRDFAAGPWLQTVTYSDQIAMRDHFDEVTRWHHAAQHPLREPLLMAAVLRLLSTITASGEASADTSSPAELARALHLIESRQEDPTLAISDVARAAGTSPSSLRRLFRKHIQTTPANYLTSLRLHRAHDLLERTTLSIKEIASRVGYADPLYFSRVFRQHYQQSPAAFKAQANASHAQITG